MSSLLRNILGNKKSIDGPVVKIIYATRTGNAQFIAEELERQLITVKVACKVVNAIKYSLNDLKSEKYAIVICSTFGLGDPVPSAFKLYKELQSEESLNLQTTEYAMFALGDTKYETFCGGGKKIDAELLRGGAKPIFDRIDCDLDFGEIAAGWIGELCSYFESHEAFKQ